ncbi:4-hydroxy-2-oxoglutarate aldolase, mitochondrial [Daphnia magna]|uniref:4-hydroxy-2-oxoglutarate aldolase, mitochondrial n=1 Tax=Daphnia magna TaxID=35525 RepID=UPI001E1BC5CB|nr:4-hydroxy-2-oxoglutarate aldolase, mitochondrial [Daphnia magna]
MLCFGRAYPAISRILPSCVRPYSSAVIPDEKGIQLGGIYPPLTTPFNADETISFDKLADNLTQYARIPFAGYVVQGSNGEYPFLEKEEKLQIVKFVKDFIKESNKPLIAGSGCESTKATIRLTEEMAACGADAVMVVTPSYFKISMNDAAMIAHYTTVADSSPVPVILYSVPANTGIDLSIDAIQILAKHPNIIGLKDSGGDVTRIGSIVQKTRGQDFKVLSGSASFLLPSYLAGSVGGVCALANVLGDVLCHMHSLYEKNIIDKELQRRLIDPNNMVTRRFGVAGMKAALDMFGYYGGPNRSPMLSVSAEARLVIKKAFVDNEFVPQSR